MRNNRAGQSRKATIITIAFLLAVIGVGTYATQALLSRPQISVGRGSFYHKPDDKAWPRVPIGRGSYAPREFPTPVPPKAFVVKP